MLAVIIQMHKTIFKENGFRAMVMLNKPHKIYSILIEYKLLVYYLSEKAFPDLRINDKLPTLHFGSTDFEK
jgi:hypothetical protein